MESNLQTKFNFMMSEIFQCSSSANMLPSPSLSSSRSGGDLYESEASTALLGGGSVRGSTNLSRNKVVLNMAVFSNRLSNELISLPLMNVIFLWNTNAQITPLRLNISS